ncbi:MAG TPA: SRPBCC family protein [Fimbriimonadaceae bacterium]|nr:SRPBCC family protein [Fimbriimonadaceae bacterium]HRJ97037.1 SRPBCC family protein [Fimbriimonadaceae bacterium]
MASNDYRFLTLWTLDGTIEEAAEVLEDVEGLTQWWPSVYLASIIEDKGGAKGIGKRIRLLTRGWLPYQLRWTLIVAASESPHRFGIEAEGDFLGTGIWGLKQVGDQAEITFDWQVRANKPLLRLLSFVLRPIFEANHRWAMKQGEKSLRLEVRRRRAERDGRLERLPRPPGPALYSGPLLFGGAILLLLMAAASKRRRAQVEDEA